MRGLIVALLAAGAVADAAGAPRPPACRSAQYTVDGDAIGTGAVRSPTLEVGTLVGIGDACPLIPPAKVRVTKRGVTQVRAKWDACPGFTGSVRLRARVGDECTSVV